MLANTRTGGNCVLRAWPRAIWAYQTWMKHCISHVSAGPPPLSHTLLWTRLLCGPRLSKRVVPPPAVAFIRRGWAERARRGSLCVTWSGVSAWGKAEAVDTWLIKKAHDTCLSWDHTQRLIASYCHLALQHLDLIESTSRIESRVLFWLFSFAPQWDNEFIRVLRGLFFF